MGRSQFVWLRPYLENKIMHIPVTKEDKQIAIELAALRNGTKEPYQNKSTQKHSDIDTHILGALGEIAFSGLTGLEIDKSSRKRGDNGVDFYLSKNLTIELKTREASGQNSIDLAVFDTHPWNIKADFLVLCTVNPEQTEVRFLGFTTKIRMIYLGEQLKFGSRIRWGCRQKNLYPMKWMIDYIDKTRSIEPLSVSRL